jgi:glycosyltransferase involved in cell wall biosynthesis
MLGITCWCPEDRHERARVAAECVQALLDQAATVRTADVDVIVADNDVRHPLLRRVLETAEARMGTRVLRLAPQRGWAGARNAIISRFLEGDSDRLVLCDDDIRVEGDWLSEVGELVHSDPDLQAYLLMSQMQEFRGVFQLSSGRLAWIAREFHGGIHVLGRQPLMVLGGYNTTDFPHAWGFHDCEYGLRLRAAGLLEATQGCYVDPIMHPVVELGQLDRSMGSEAQREIIDRYLPVYARRELEVQLGRGLYHPYE